MPLLETNATIDLIGYGAGLVSLWGMYLKTMIPLRAAAVVGNVGFIAFGLLVTSYPTLILHAVLLPINVWRLIEMRRLVEEIRGHAADGQSLEPLLPYMRRMRKSAGSILFRKDDPADRMILIGSGEVELPEISVTCGPGAVLGEIAAFTPEGRRTCSAICRTDCELHVLPNETMVQLFHQNPKFSMFLTQLIVGRLLENWTSADVRARGLPG